jgi:hypothetical protein
MVWDARCAVRIAGAYCSCSATQNTWSAARAAAAMTRAMEGTLMDIGFSSSTCNPAWNASTAAASCWLCSSMMSTGAPPASAFANDVYAPHGSPEAAVTLAAIACARGA